MTRRDGERLYGCWRCGQHKPRRAFDLGPKGRYLGRICRDCRREEAEAREARRTTRRLANSVIVKRCSNCRRWRMRTVHFSVWKRWPDGTPRYWNSWCNTCLAERQRINYALRAEAEGRTVKPYRGARQAPYVRGTGRHGLPLEPLQAWLQAVIEHDDVEAFAHSLGVDSRALWRIQHGEHDTVSLGVADTMLTNYGRPVVIRSCDLERRLMQWAQGLPGNGARLLAYMDRAEAVAHLADVAVLRVDDLYPELDEEG